MRRILLIVIAVLVFAGAALGEELQSPPALTLSGGGMEQPVAGNYSWTYPAGGPDEWTGVEACGMGPTDPALLDTLEPVYLMEDQSCTIGWNGTPPDELIVFSWDIAVFSDQEHIDDYQENPEIVIRKADGRIILRPDRIYDFQAKWLPSEGSDRPYGNANYFLLTEQLIMDDGPGSVMAGGWTPSADFAITEELKAIFEKGTETLTGVSYIPVAYLGSQVVAGTNRAFLCRAVTAYPGALETEPACAIVYLYEDLQGSVSILNIADFDIGAFCTYGAE